MIITRRSFIKSIGLCTVFTTMGDINEGLSFFPYHFSTDNQRTGSYVWIQNENTAKHIYIGVGEPGFKVEKALLARIQKAGILEEDPLPIQQFSPENHELNGFIANSHVVFLVGSIKDKEFWAARELILSHPIALLNTIIVAEENPKILAKSFKVHENEGCIFVQGKNYQDMAALNVFSLFSMLMMPGHVGYNFADHTSVMSGKSGYMVHTESSYQDSRKEFEKTVCFYKRDIVVASGILLNMMYNETISYTLDDMGAISDMVYKNSSDDTELIWNCSEEPRNLGVEFRASMFIPFS